MADSSQFDAVLIQAAIDNLQRRVENVVHDVAAHGSQLSELGKAEAVFEYKHEQAKRVSDKLEQIVDKISERGEDELRETIAMIDRREAKLAESIIAHKELVLRDTALQHQTLRQSIDNLASLLDDVKKSQEADRKDFLTMQKWMWTLMGAIATLSFVADKLISLVSG